MRHIESSLIILAVVAACGGRETARTGDSAVTLASSAPAVTRATFGTLPDGGVVEQFSLKNAHGIEVRTMSYGASVTSIKTPDRAGTLSDIVFGYDSLSAYVSDASYFGPTVGRFANRIARAHFTLDGRTYRLAVNDGVNTLHGGRRGLNKA